MYSIAAGHIETARAAENVLQSGGNAIDAAIAAFFVSCVAEPCMTGVGGGAFATVLTDSGKAMVFDFFCQTPKSKKIDSSLDFYPIKVNFGPITETFHIGKGSTGVPGTVAGMYALHRQFGSIPMPELLQPALGLAKSGVTINEFQYYDFQLLEAILRVDPRGYPIYFEEGELKKPGAVQYMPQFADFLEVLSHEGQDFFYRGEIARQIASDYQGQGGLLTRADFEDYQVAIRAPLQFTYRDYEIFTNPLPSHGGAHLALFLKLLEKDPPSQQPYDKQHAEMLADVFYQLEKAKKAPGGIYGALQNILNQSEGGKIPKGPSKRGATTHFSILDKEGNAVSLTGTNGEGCGYFVEGTDIQLNNMLGEAALLPGGFHSWTPDTRLSSMMAPTIGMHRGESSSEVFVTGSGGAGRIPGAIAQVISYLADFDLGVFDAVNGPRVHLEEDCFHIGRGFFPDFVLEDLHVPVQRWQEKSLFFGGVHTVMKKGEVHLAAGDDRRDGVALVSD